jgi:small subunit ribosomal protein S6
MRTYEFVIVLRPTLKDEERKKLLVTVKGWLGKEVSIAKEEELGQKLLAYPIKKESAGLYFVWHLESETGVPAGFEQKVIQNDQVLRHLLLRTK